MIIDASSEKHRSKWEDSSFVFIILPIVLILFIPTGGLLYICGRMSFHPGLIIAILYPASGIFIIFSFVKGIIRLVRDWRGDMKLLLFTQICLPIVFAVFVVMIPSGMIESQLWPDAPAFLSGFRDRIKSKADIPAIREWLRTLDKGDYDDNAKPLPTDKWPKSLKVLNPPGIHIMRNQQGNLRIKIIWGGGLFHWGVIIGVEDLEIPASEFVVSHGNWLSVQPGVYVYDW